MSKSIRPDVHERFLAVVARADAKVRREQAEKRSASLMTREPRERPRAMVNEPA